MREQRDQMLGHQFEKLSWYVIRSRRAVRSQSLYLFKHFLMNDVTETEGGMRVICKTIDQPVDVLVEHWRRSSSAVEAKCLLRSSRSERSGCWLGWRIRCIVLHTSFGRFEESAVIINDCLAFLIRFLSCFECIETCPMHLF